MSLGWIPSSAAWWLGGLDSLFICGKQLNSPRGGNPNTQLAFIFY